MYIQYDLIRAHKNELLGEALEDYLNDGWELYSAPFSADGYFYQAIILK